MSKENQNLKIKVGCQGWNYRDWITPIGDQTVFYPHATKTSKMLKFYAKVFNTVEVDSSFDSVPSTSTLENWHQKTPNGFVFSLKLPKEISHLKSLNKTSFETLEEFCERIKVLGEKLGVVLIQLAPSFIGSKENAQNLRAFLAQLPKDIQFAVEFRNRDWWIEWTSQELRKNSVALCFDKGSWIQREAMFAAVKSPTADFTYTRFMGERDLTDFSKIIRPQDSSLEVWRAALEQLPGESNFVYFSNFYEGFAPGSSQRFKQLLGQKITEPYLLEPQRSLF